MSMGGAWSGVILVSWLLLFLAGFAWGRRRGRAEGERLGLREAPLVWRQASLLAGRCAICQAEVTGEDFPCWPKEV
ncbi:MAG: hypothetical protein PWR31_1627 [Bacillota bacterium]|nr:hypothetical protein [Bacillota bacterium]MDK2927936.1 hypothetical protein [Bacillota bacterium]